ncbi:hypothetical protein C7212DRAFT_352549 [Tuber magnatum]|uniref:DUF7582 domain-containing protein n=1 Tax=Tuber magnatum TaxID=42249 RepID=A0A317SWP9_9PEZI|nr:hypothetical protein C7212DRAFT_352549 [Tuber magnatum]
MEAHTVTKALEYISKKLCRKGIHVHLIVAGDALSCLLFKSRPTTHTISILQASALSPRSLSILFDSVHRAQKKFGLANDWVNTDLGRQVDSDYLDYVIHKSLLQNEIVFSSEGLTLVAVDLCFALKSKLESLTKNFTQKDIEDAVVLLRRLVVIYRGRPLTKGYIRTSYPRMEVSDQILLRLNELYEWQYHTRGVVGVRDEYMEWRREGIVDWPFGIEDLKREVSVCAPLEKELYSWRDKPLPDTPYREDFAEIFTQQKVY